MSYTKETIKFVRELGDHVHDPENRWHKQNTERCNQVLYDPTKELVQQLRSYIRESSQSVADAKRIVGALKKPGKDGDGGATIGLRSMTQGLAQRGTHSNSSSTWTAVRRAVRGAVSRGGTTDSVWTVIAPRSTSRTSTRHSMKAPQRQRSVFATCYRIQL